MTKVDENITQAKKMLSGIVERCYELEEENKKLKECNKSQSEVINNVFIPQRERLEEENRKLKEIIRKNVNGCPYGGLYCGQYLGL